MEVRVSRNSFLFKGSSLKSNSCQNRLGASNHCHTPRNQKLSLPFSFFFSLYFARWHFAIIQQRENQIIFDIGSLQLSPHTEAPPHVESLFSLKKKQEEKNLFKWKASVFVPVFAVSHNIQLFPKESHINHPTVIDHLIHSHLFRQEDQHFRTNFSFIKKMISKSSFWGGGVFKLYQTFYSNKVNLTNQLLQMWFVALKDQQALSLWYTFPNGCFLRRKMTCV